MISIDQHIPSPINHSEQLYEAIPASSQESLKTLMRPRREECDYIYILVD